MKKKFPPRAKEFIKSDVPACPRSMPEKPKFAFVRKVTPFKWLKSVLLLALLLVDILVDWL